jgi:hypothetical protein
LVLVVLVLPLEQVTQVLLALIRYLIQLHQLVVVAVEPMELLLLELMVALVVVHQIQPILLTEEREQPIKDITVAQALLVLELEAVAAVAVLEVLE